MYGEVHGVLVGDVHGGLGAVVGDLFEGCVAGIDVVELSGLHELPDHVGAVSALPNDVVLDRIRNRTLGVLVGHQTAERGCVTSAEGAEVGAHDVDRFITGGGGLLGFGGCLARLRVVVAGAVDCQSGRVRHDLSRRWGLIADSPVRRLDDTKETAAVDFDLIVKAASLMARFARSSFLPFRRELLLNLGHVAR